MPETNPINWDKALTTVGGDSELLSELLSVYVSEANQMLRQIDTAIETDDRSLIRRSAHTLKGASLSVAATHTSQQCEQLEEGCDGMNQDQLADQVSAVRAAATDAIAAIHTRLGQAG